MSFLNYLLAEMYLTAFVVLVGLAAQAVAGPVWTPVPYGSSITTTASASDPSTTSSNITTTASPIYDSTSSSSVLTGNPTVITVTTCTTYVTTIYSVTSASTTISTSNGWSHTRKSKSSSVTGLTSSITGSASSYTSTAIDPVTVSTSSSSSTRSVRLSSSSLPPFPIGNATTSYYLGATTGTGFHFPTAPIGTGSAASSISAQHNYTRVWGSGSHHWSGSNATGSWYVTGTGASSSTTSSSSLNNCTEPAPTASGSSSAAFSSSHNYTRVWGSGSHHWSGSNATGGWYVTGTGTGSPAPTMPASPPFDNCTETGNATTSSRARPTMSTSRNHTDSSTSTSSATTTIIPNLDNCTSTTTKCYYLTHIFLLHSQHHSSSYSNRVETYLRQYYHALHRNHQFKAYIFFKLHHNFKLVDSHP